MTLSPACQDRVCEQCDGRVVLDNNIYVCECVCHAETPTSRDGQ